MEDVLGEIRRQYHHSIARSGGLVEPTKLYLSPGSYTRLRMTKDYYTSHAPAAHLSGERFMGMEILIARSTSRESSSDDPYVHVC